MKTRKTAVVEVDNLAELASFHGWLSRNREQVLAISENKGCGCCVDIFVMDLDDGAEAMPWECDSAGDFDAGSLRVGQEKEAIISAFLHHRATDDAQIGPSNRDSI
jgi:hypothetical protein